MLLRFGSSIDPFLVIPVGFANRVNTFALAQSDTGAPPETGVYGRSDSERQRRWRASRFRNSSSKLSTTGHRRLDFAASIHLN